MSDGYVKLWRKSKDSRVFRNEGLWKIWTWCLMKASHKERWVSVKIGKAESEIKVYPGQFIFGRHSASKQLKMNPNTIWKRMQKLKTMSNLNIESNNHYSVVSIINWDSYQETENKSNSESNSRVTAECQPSNTDKNEKNVKEVLTGKFALDFFGPNLNGFDKAQVEKTVNGLISLRKQNKISISVLEKEFEYWNKYPDKIINNSLTVYNNAKYWEKSKGEKYLRGIIRGKMKEHENQNSQSLSKKAF